MLFAYAILYVVCSLIAIAILKRATLGDRFLYSNSLCTMSSTGSLHSRTMKRKQSDKRLASLVATQIAKVIPQIFSELNEN
ncbi:hypothetical protein Hanom_Chr04g00321051 [Helianthus anomalus]